MDTTLEVLHISDYGGRSFGARVQDVADLPTATAPQARTASAARSSNKRFPFLNSRTDVCRIEPLEDHSSIVEDFCENTLLGVDAHPVEGFERRETRDIPRDRWVETRNTLFSNFLSTSEARAQSNERTLKLLQQQIQLEVTKHSVVCPTCGFRRLEARVGSDDRVHISFRAPQQVLYVGLSYRFVVNVPIRVCGGCGITFSVCPLDINCIPGSPNEAWDVSTSRKEHTPIWFDIGLVSFFELGQNVMRRFSVFKLAEWLDRTHLDNGCSSITIPFDKLRKSLGESLREWGYVMCRINNMQGMGVKQWPTGNKP